MLVFGEYRTCRFTDWSNGMQGKDERVCCGAHSLLGAVWSVVGVAFCPKRAICMRNILGSAKYWLKYQMYDCAIMIACMQFPWGRSLRRNDRQCMHLGKCWRKGMSCLATNVMENRVDSTAQSVSLWTYLSCTGVKCTRNRQIHFCLFPLVLYALCCCQN